MLAVGNDDIVESMVSYCLITTRRSSELVSFGFCLVKGVDFREEPACWKDLLSNELNTIRDKYISLEKDVDQNNQGVLEETNSRYLELEREFQVLQQEKYSLLDKVSKSCQNLTLVSEEREILLERYKSEIHKRRNLEQGIEQFSVAFASRKKSLASFHSEFKSKVDNLKSQNPAVVISSLGF